eukprot:s812_g8.t1
MAVRLDRKVKAKDNDDMDSLSALEDIELRDVTAAVRQDLLSRVKLCWTLSLGKSQAPTIVLLHGWLGEKADWTEVSKCLVEERKLLRNTSRAFSLWIYRGMVKLRLVPALRPMPGRRESYSASLQGATRRRRGLCSTGLVAAAILSVTLACTAFVQGPAPRSAAARTARAATKQKKKAPNREVIDLEDFDAWEVLSLPPDADKQKIRRRFRKLVATQHPDKRPNDPDAKAKFMQIKKAYEQLMGQDNTIDELKLWAEQNREWSAREFLGEEEDGHSIGHAWGILCGLYHSTDPYAETLKPKHRLQDLPPPEVPGGLYVGLSILICVLAYGTYWALNK